MSCADCMRIRACDCVVGRERTRVTYTGCGAVSVVQRLMCFRLTYSARKGGEGGVRVRVGGVERVGKGI